MSRLRVADTSLPGFRRRRHGRGFSYADEHGEPLRDETALARIRGLAVPPAWRDVWICPWPNGHIQAIGVDAAGRRQYLYHAAWRERRDAEKFERMLEFARALPAGRSTVAEHLELPGLPRERVLACAVRLLDRCFFRIGGEEYAEENGTVGLATMRRDHVRLLGDDTIRFEYPAKGGVQRRQLLVDPQAFEVLGQLRARRSGEELLAHRRGRRWVDVRSHDVNAYLRELLGGPYSAKDFRTWHATVLAALALSVLGRDARSETARTRAILHAVDEVAHYLGNTRAVCRTSYIDPRVFEAFRANRTVAPALGRMSSLRLDGRDHELLADAERAVLRMLGGARPGGARRPRRRAVR
jgi:DNA topoisomerase IB